jgi:hypothetical protein
VKEVLLQQDPQTFAGIHPNKDVASIPKVKNLDIVQLGLIMWMAYPRWLQTIARLTLLGGMSEK